MIERAYDGCGRCYIGVRRLSQMSASTSSPQRQREDALAAVKAAGGHVIAWADDWEVSGATDPMTRPRLGPWLRGERGPYNGIAGAAVDRLGRNLVDCLNTGYMMRDTGLALLTYGHDGPWNLDDPNDENRFTMEAWGAQMELRAIQRRNRDAAVKARAAGRVKAKPSYGYRYVRLVPTGAVDHVALHEHAASVIRNVARRILVLKPMRNAGAPCGCSRLLCVRRSMARSGKGPSPDSQVRFRFVRDPDLGQFSFASSGWKFAESLADSLKRIAKASDAVTLDLKIEKSELLTGIGSEVHPLDPVVIHQEAAAGAGGFDLAS
ncbi:recombinase family protein [Streptomyces sp. NPDC001770]